MNIRNAFILLVVASIGFMAFRSYTEWRTSRRVEQEFASAKEWLDAELKRTRDTAGRETVIRQSGHTSAQTLQLLATQDSLVQRVQDLQRRNDAIYAQVIQLRTRDTAEAPVTVTVTDSCPTYSSTFSDRWLHAKLTATCEGAMLDYDVRNDLSIWQTNERSGGLFSPRRPIVHIRNNNPHTITTDERTWTVKTKPPRRGYWALGGFVVGVGGSILLYHQLR
jgi:hypothetical protein